MKRAKRQPYEPYKVTLGGKVYWQVNLPGRRQANEDGRLVRVRPRRTFSSAGEARTFADSKRIERHNHGVAAVTMDDKLCADTLAAQKLLVPYGITVLEAAEYYVSHEQRLKQSETVARAIQALLEAKASENLRPRYLHDLRLRLAKFGHEFGDRLLADIEAAEIEDWLRSLGLAPLGRNTYRLRLNALFEFALKSRWVETNPVREVAKAKVRTDREPGILTADQTARLLERASEKTLPFLAIGLFAGLRSAELERLDWEDIDLDENLIAVPAASAKTGSRRFVTIQPNLAEWLAPYRNRRLGSLPVCPPNLRKLLTADRRAAGFTKWPSNACRHSFGSYHLAHFNNPGLTAVQMGHTNTDMLWSHYHHRVKPAEAERFWRIAPAVEGAELIKAIA
jgi:integrase